MLLKIQSLLDSDGWLLVDGIECMPRDRLAKRLNLSVKTLNRWDCGCPFFDGKPIVPRLFLRHGYHPAATYDRTTVENLEAKIEEARVGRYVDGEGMAWISVKRTLKVLNARGKRKEVLLCYLRHGWRKRCRHLEGEALIGKHFAFGIARAWHLWLREDQILTIKASLQKATVKKKPAEPVPHERKRRAIETFDGVFDETEGKRFTIWRAAQESGFTWQRFYRWLKKGLPKEFAHFFSDGIVPIEKRLVPGSKDHWVLTILESDLKQLKVGVGQATRGYIPSYFQTAAEICDAHGIRGFGPRFLANDLLRHWYAVGVLQGRSICRVGGGHRGWSKPLLFDTRQLPGLLAGRNLQAAAEELEQGKGKAVVEMLQSVLSKGAADSRQIVRLCRKEGRFSLKVIYGCLDKAGVQRKWSGKPGQKGRSCVWYLSKIGPEPVQNLTARLQGNGSQPQDGKTSSPANGQPEPRRTKMGPKPIRKKLVVQEYCYVEFRLKEEAKRAKVWEGAKREYKERAPKREEGVTILADRFAEKFGYPKYPSAEQRDELLKKLAEEGSLIPKDL